MTESIDKRFRKNRDTDNKATSGGLVVTPILAFY